MRYAIEIDLDVAGQISTHYVSLKRGGRAWNLEQTP